MTNATETTDFATVVAVPTAALRHRDSKGRFQCPPLHIDFVRSRGTMWTDDDRNTHCRNHCGDIVGRVRRTTSPGWLCATCIEVDSDHGLPDDPAPKIGSSRCEGCDVMLTMTKYPTALVTGVGQVRDFRVCRKCRKSGIHPKGEFGVDPNDADALAEAVANDWRPKRRYDRASGKWVPDPSPVTVDDPGHEWWDDDPAQPVLGPDPRTWAVPWAVGATDDTRPGMIPTNVLDGPGRVMVSK